MIVHVYFHYETKVFNVICNCEYQNLNNNAILKVYDCIFLKSKQRFSILYVIKVMDIYINSQYTQTPYPEKLAGQGYWSSQSVIYWGPAPGVGLPGGGSPCGQHQPGAWPHRTHHRSASHPYHNQQVPYKNKI